MSDKLDQLTQRIEQFFIGNQELVRALDQNVTSMRQELSEVKMAVEILRRDKDQNSIETKKLGERVEKLEEQRLKALESQVTKRDTRITKLEESSIILKRLVYGAVGLILTLVMVGLVALVVQKPSPNPAQQTKKVSNK